MPKTKRSTDTKRPQKASRATGGSKKKPTVNTITLGVDDAHLVASLLDGPTRETTPSMRKALANYGAQTGK